MIEKYSNTPTLHFAPSLPWSCRGQAPDAPGLYAIFKGNPETLIYVGLTRQAGGLRGRLAQFHRSASTGRHNHAGGVTYHQFFGPDVSDLIFSVHVAADALAASKGLSTYLRDAERSTIWQHIMRHGRPPACNKA